MSELTKCNYCTLQNLKKNLKLDEKLSRLGNDFYKHPKDLDIKDMTFAER